MHVSSTSTFPSRMLWHENNLQPKLAFLLHNKRQSQIVLPGKKPAANKAAPRKKAASPRPNAATRAKQASPAKNSTSDVEVALTDAEQQKSDVESSLQEAGMTVSYSGTARMSVQQLEACQHVCMSGDACQRQFFDIPSIVH